ncbi:MAG: leucine-rich repeat domain-containing protein, partial [Propionibacteriaceae bacterium]|nr:leucine-rich repeat domain-containing protein [Propionibacteriaceae bacterium]
MRSTRLPTRLLGVGTALVLAVGVLAGVAPVASAGPNDPVTIPDTNLRACINSALGQPSGATVTISQAQTLASLSCPNRGIANLTGLEAFTSLHTLTLYLNVVSSVAPLAGLTSLTNLGLSGNQVSDVSPLGGLTSLTYLNLSGNRVTDMSPLAGLSVTAYLDAQSVVLPGGSVTEDYLLPVVTDKYGSHPVLSVSGGGYVINALAGTITFLDYGWYKFEWHAPDFFSGIMTVVVPPDGSIMVGSVSVFGGSSVGSVLTASVFNVFPSDATVSYQWLRAGEPIVGATQSTYTLTTRDMCLQISVRGTVS